MDYLFVGGMPEVVDRFISSGGNYTEAREVQLQIRKSEDSSVFKLYLLDVGLYNCLMEIKWNDICGLNYDELISKGDMAEQFVAQHLYLNSYSTSRPRVNYWLKDKKAENAEVDFVVSINNKIVPIEVKAGKSGRIKSLIRFMFEHRRVVNVAKRFDLKYRENFIEDVEYRLKVLDKIETVSFSLHNYPLYSVGKKY